jgi:hypothetical protein
MVGECTGRMVPELQRLGWGRMWMAIGRNIYTYPDEPWGFDNAAFRYYLRGVRFDDAAYEKRLGKALKVGVPYLAVVPDRVAHPESLAFSVLWRRKLPDGWPWYLAVQDGMTRADVRPYLGMFAGLFLGGTDRFKATGKMWAEYAHDHGKRFHYGRAGTPAKVEHAFEVGADSLDSAFPMWTKARFRFFEQVITNGHPQHRLAVA